VTEYHREVRNEDRESAAEDEVPHATVIYGRHGIPHSTSLRVVYDESAAKTGTVARIVVKKE
jgi:hypothetical protein